MNTFVQHHRTAISFSYRCFDRMLCNAYVQPFLYAGNIAAFFKHQRCQHVTRASFKRISADYHDWLGARAGQQGLEIVEPPADVRREDWVQPYYHQLGARDGVAVILRCREPARVAVCRPRNYIELAWRHVNLYYFYLQDQYCGRMFVRVCPYFPFNCQVYLNGHQWLARQLQREGIAFEQRDNAFVACAAPARLQELADSFGPEHINAAVEPWLAAVVPYFTPQERSDGYRHRLFLAQVEYCDNLVFHKQAALDRLFARMVEANCTLGQPRKLALIFGRQQFFPDTRTGEVRVKLSHLNTPVLSTRFQNTFLKQYVRDHVLLRTESASHQLRDLSLPKDIKNLPRVREVLHRSNQRLLEAQQDILGSFTDRGQLQTLRQPTVSASGRRTPGLRLDDPRVLALLQALTCFSHLAGKGSFRTRHLLGDVQRVLDRPDYRLSQLRYDLAKVRGKGLVVRLRGSQRYEVTPKGYRIAVLYCKLYHRLYAPLTAAILDPVTEDAWLPNDERTRLDRLYHAVDAALHRLGEHIGLAS